MTVPTEFFGFFPPKKGEVNTGQIKTTKKSKVEGRPLKSSFCECISMLHLQINHSVSHSDFMLLVRYAKTRRVNQLPKRFNYK